MKTPQHVEMHFVNPEQFKKGNGGGHEATL